MPSILRMSVLARQRADFLNILARWDGALADWRAHHSDRDRDSAILRFELTFEVAWKHLQALARDQGLESAGPRQAFENAFRLGWVDDEVIFEEILRARNLAVHVYREASAQALAERLPDFQAAFARLAARLPAVS